MQAGDQKARQHAAGIRVAIVEDNHELREGLAELLRGTSDIECVGAFANCDRFLADLSSIRPDVVLMDLGLPGMSGVEGVREVKFRFPGIDVLVLTVYDDEKRIFESVCAGASGYLLKKTPPAGIVAAIREIRTGGAPMTANVARRVLEMFQKTAPTPPTEPLLSEREKEVLEGLIKGMSYKMIGETYNVSVDAVRSRIRKIYDKLHVHTKSEAVAKALKRRML